MNDLHIHTDVQPRSLTPNLIALHPQGPIHCHHNFCEEVLGCLETHGFPHTGRGEQGWCGVRMAGCNDMFGN